MLHIKYLSGQHGIYGNKNGPETDAVYEEDLTDPVETLPDNINHRQEYRASDQDKSHKSEERHRFHDSCLEQDNKGGEAQKYYCGEHVVEQAL